jgi:type VI secretion system secreted protein VgrG
LSVELVRQDRKMRYFTGYVFSFRLVRADGGIAFYKAKLGPWLKYLALRKDCFLFHEAPLYEQTSSIFRDYLAHPEWEVHCRGQDLAMT